MYKDMKRNLKIKKKVEIKRKSMGPDKKKKKKKEKYGQIMRYNDKKTKMMKKVPLVPEI